MEIKNIIDLKIIASTFIFLVGGFDNMFITLLIFIALDYITGIIKAIYQKKLNSKLGLKGFLKKLGYILIVIVASLFDSIIGDKQMAIRTLCIYFFISNEAISILENWAVMGLPLPKKIFQVFESLKEE
ncbi:MAG: phage holin family protein [Bacilli bacterium]|nr:phage holin family protein [Bacilli bacterium]